MKRQEKTRHDAKLPRMPNKRTSVITEDNDNHNGFLFRSVSPSSTPLPWTKQELQGGSTGAGLDTVDPADDAIPPASSGFPVMVGNDPADASSISPASADRGNKHPIDADIGSSCSSRCTDAPSSEASERQGPVAIDGSRAAVGSSVASKSAEASAAEQPTKDDAVATPRTLRVNACLSC